VTSSPAPKKRSRRWITVLVAVIIVILLLIAAAEFGLRAYLKGNLADEMRDKAQDKGIELSADPEVDFGSSPLIVGLVRGEIPELTMKLPSSLKVDYQDSDRSKPVVSGQPAVKATMKDVSTSGDDDATIGSLSMDTTLPPEYLLAQVQKSMQDSGSGDAGQGNPLGGLLTVNDVKPNTADQTLDFQVAGGLATVAMKPVMTDQGFTMEVADVKLLGFSLPDSLTDSMKDSLQQSIDQADNLEIQSAEITDEGLKVRLGGQDVTMDQLADDASNFTKDTGSGSGSGSTATSGAAAA
jgi:hypothetical protein